jgi:hypothetical protein
LPESPRPSSPRGSVSSPKPSPYSDNLLAQVHRSSVSTKMNEGLPLGWEARVDPSGK